MNENSPSKLDRWASYLKNHAAPQIDETTFSRLADRERIIQISMVCRGRPYESHLVCRLEDSGEEFVEIRRREMLFRAYKFYALTLLESSGLGEEDLIELSNRFARGRVLVPDWPTCSGLTAFEALRFVRDRIPLADVMECPRPSWHEFPKYQVVVEFPDGRIGKFNEPAETEDAAWIATAETLQLAIRKQQLIQPGSGTWWDPRDLRLF